MTFTLPKTVNVDGSDLDIRYDYRVILEIIIMLQDHDLSGEDKTEALLEMFYLNPDEIRNYKAAIEACFDFIDCGSKRKTKKQPKVTDWEQDFEYIVAPINRVLGYDIRGVEYDPVANTGGLHWWTFISAYMEIGGDCLYSQIVSIRDKKARNKKLEKHEREWARRNADLVNLKQHYTESESALFDEWTKGG